MYIRTYIVTHLCTYVFLINCLVEDYPCAYVYTYVYQINKCQKSNNQLYVHKKYAFTFLFDLRCEDDMYIYLLCYAAVLIKFTYYAQE